MAELDLSRWQAKRLRHWLESHVFEGYRQCRACNSTGQTPTGGNCHECHGLGYQVKAAPKEATSD